MSKYCVTVSYLFVSMMLYGWAIIQFVYVLSFLCKEASNAFNFIGLFNALSGMYSLLMFYSQVRNTVYCCDVIVSVNPVS